ncbi:MAG: Methyltransferase domain-containing protein [Nitrospira sp.]|nr:MAG: Methyltransferase domain-containing protein [Nitrospira sp.]
MPTDSLHDSLHAHLAHWGLRSFSSDADYFAWQRAALSAADLHQLAAQAERKRSGARQDEIAFYDLTAQPQILPVLYSQRYEYFMEIGSRVAPRIAPAETVLDFGCGVGILTTFYARQYPETQFVGVDRSPGSIAVAQSQAGALGLSNVRFECCDVEADSLAGTYDAVIATHALVQVEQDSGIPSRDWTTFARAQDLEEQTTFERRTGIDVRLDRLDAVLNPGGRMMLFEKTRQLARRVPFQRALARRGWQLVERPEPIRYRLVEEVADDGPFYVMEKGRLLPLAWDEAPESDEGLPFDRAMLQATPSDPQDPERPLYENHWPSAQRVWESLANRLIEQEETRRESDGRQLHVELGSVEGAVYLYCANTFDQRQLILVERRRKGLLDSYYREIFSS